MQTSKERKQQKETTRNETRNFREDTEKQRGSNIEESEIQNTVHTESRNSGIDATDSSNKSPVSLRRRSKFSRNDTL